MGERPSGDYEMTVAAFGLTEAEWEALFDRVADAAHALDEQVTCSGGPAAPDSSLPPASGDTTETRSVVSGETGGALTAEERQELATSLHWHFRCHAAEPDKSYASLGIENATLIVERILAARLADRDAALARVEALADEWAADIDGLPRADVCARQLRAALRPDPSERGGE